MSPVCASCLAHSLPSLGSDSFAEAGLHTAVSATGHERINPIGVIISFSIVPLMYLCNYKSLIPTRCLDSVSTGPSTHEAKSLSESGTGGENQRHGVNASRANLQASPRQDAEEADKGATSGR